MLGRLPSRLLAFLAAVLLLAAYVPAAEAADPPACGIRSPASFKDTAGRNAIQFQKTGSKMGDTLLWNTDDNRTLKATTVRIRFAGQHFMLNARGEGFTIAGQGNLKTGNFGGSLVERKIVRETDSAGRTKSRTARTVRSIVAQAGKTQWVACPKPNK